ncbi:Amidohydrolase family protein [Sulfidibacter corallicola]|uniref:Amidohydrolase family protein n=1 Tax=Sulfidibacter corallicola TaxID=2818388 RepID=A0A8A4TMG1_SULCO|nr:amidohydrolase family protein [Sulfidibacter corallicola]QTD50071.1 amidohydrolase family protein [Sulfidibacter corallicola]
MNIVDEFGRNHERVVGATNPPRVMFSDNHPVASRSAATRVGTLRSMTWKYLALLVALAFGGVALAHDMIPAPAQTRPIALRGATIHTMAGAPIENGTIVFDAGKIVALGADVQIPSGTQLIEATGKHIYPGLIASNTRLGLVETNAVKATVDFQEHGDHNPNVRAERAINPDSEQIPVTRTNGVALAMARPFGLLAGQGAVIRLDGWTYEEMTLQPRAAMFMDWPRSDFWSPPWLPPKRKEEFKKKRAKRLKELDAFVEKAKAYHQAKKAAEAGGKSPEFDPRLEAMGALLRGEQPIWITANRADQIHEALDFTARHGLKMVLVGGDQAMTAVEILEARDIPVVLQRINALPVRRDDTYDEAFTLPNRLREAGIRFCIAVTSRMGNTRNLAYEAAAAVPFGLPEDEALKAVTLYPAQIMGIADRVGSLEKGKDATLIVADGNILEIPTQVEHMFIEGRAIDLDNRHRQLYRKYKTKYDRIKGE